MYFYKLFSCFILENSRSVKSRIDDILNGNHVGYLDAKTSGDHNGENSSEELKLSGKYRNNL